MGKSAEKSSEKVQPVVKTDDLGRKVWDTNFYSKRALLRQYEGADEFDEFVSDAARRKKLKRDDNDERRHLEQRKELLDLEVDLGKSKIVTTHTPKQQKGGYWCDVCDCLIKDSQAYLDHINGKKHNRELGMTMKVERVGVDRIKERLNKIKQV